MSTEIVAPEATEETPEASPPAEDVATLKRQVETLRGQSQALDRAQKEKDRLAQELTEAQRRLAEREQADMTEFEKAQARIKTLEGDLAKAQTGLTRAQLAAKYRKAVEFFGEDEPLPSEERLAELEKALAKPEPKPEAEPETEPPPNPQKQRVTPDNRPEHEKLLDQVRAEAQRLFR